VDRVWWKEAVIYQVYVRSFFDSNGDGIGDLPGLISRLDYLKELGVNVLWLNPVYQSPNDDNGYDISDYKDIMKEFGTMTDWENMLAKSHEQGIKIIMDLVVNHSSDEHKWFIESRKSKDNPFRDYYIWRPSGSGPKGEPNNWESLFSGTAWEKDELTGEFYLHYFSRKQPDLNWDSPALRREILDMMTWWLDKGIDGFRMDAVHLMQKPAGLPNSKKRSTHHEGYVMDEKLYAHNPGLHGIFHEMYTNVLKNYDVMTVAEMNQTTPAMANDYVAPEREELNMIFHFEVCGIQRNWTVRKLNRIQQKWYRATWGTGWNSQFFNNHDLPRQVSIWGNDGPYRVESAKLQAAYLHTMPGSPYIYQGEEIGMTNVHFDRLSDYNDVSLHNEFAKCQAQGESEVDFLNRKRKWSRDNGRTPMQWDNTENGGFTKGTPWLGVNPNYKEINVKAALEDKNSVFYFYKDLISLRKRMPVMVYGDYKLISRWNNRICAYTRILEGETLLTVLNFSEKETSFKLPKRVKYGKAEKLLGNYEGFTNPVKHKMKPWEAAIFLLK
jgi:oligo-1,6-glucosidase